MRGAWLVRGGFFYVLLLLNKTVQSACRPRRSYIRTVQSVSQSVCVYITQKMALSDGDLRAKSRTGGIGPNPECAII